MASPSPSPNGFRPRLSPRPVPRAAPRPAPVGPPRRAPALAPPDGPDDEAAAYSGPCVYWPVIGSLAGLCVIMVVLLVLVVREKKPAPPAVPAPAAREDSAGTHVAEAVPVPAPRDNSSSAPGTPRPHEEAPAAPPAPPDADPPDDGAPAPPPPTTGLPDLLVPVSGEKCQAPAPGEAPGCGHYGTAVNFVDDPSKAAKLALKEKKLLFVLHVAGNFEDSRFT